MEMAYQILSAGWYSCGEGKGQNEKERDPARYIVQKQYCVSKVARAKGHGKAHHTGITKVP